MYNGIPFLIIKLYKLKEPHKLNLLLKNKIKLIIFKIKLIDNIKN